MSDPADAAPSSTGAQRSAVPPVLLRSAEWSWRILVVAAAIAVIGWALARLSVVLIPVFVAFVVSALLSPVVELIATRLPRLVAVWLTLITSLAAFVGIGLALWGPLRDSIGDLGSEWENAVAEIERWLSEGPLGLDPERVDSFRDSLTEAAQNLGSGLLAEPGASARTAVEVIGGFFLAIVLTFFFLKDGPTMWHWFLSRIDTVRRSTLDQAGRASFRAMQGWVRGVAITGFVDAILIGAALLILGVPAAIPLTVITFFAAFLPVVGATVAGALATLIALVSDGPGTALIVAAVVLVVQQVEGDILLPLVMQRQVSLHPVVILLALAVGAAIAGILGAIIAVPITAAMSAAVGTINSSRAEHILVDDSG